MATSSSSSQQQQQQQSSSSSSSPSAASWHDPEVRRKCFEARDGYFQCYKKEGPEECGAEYFKKYLEMCPENWRKFWDDRFKDEMKQLILEYDAREKKQHGIETRGSIAANPFG